MSSSKTHQFWLKSVLKSWSLTFALIFTLFVFKQISPSITRKEQKTTKTSICFQDIFLIVYFVYTRPTKALLFRAFKKLQGPASSHTFDLISLNHIFWRCVPWVSHFTTLDIFSSLCFRFWFHFVFVFLFWFYALFLSNVLLYE